MRSRPKRSPCHCQVPGDGSPSAGTTEPGAAAQDVLARRGLWRTTLLVHQRACHAAPISLSRVNETTCCYVTWEGARFLTEWGNCDAYPMASTHRPGGCRAGGGRVWQHFIIDLRQRRER